MDDFFVSIIVAIITMGVGFLIGLGASNVTKLENNCIVYENNVYCMEVVE